MQLLDICQCDPSCTPFETDTMKVGERERERERGIVLLSSWARSKSVGGQACDSPPPSLVPPRRPLRWKSLEAILKRKAATFFAISRIF